MTMPKVSISHANRVQRRVALSHSSLTRPENSAAMAKAKGMEKPT